MRQPTRADRPAPPAIPPGPLPERAVGGDVPDAVRRHARGVFRFLRALGAPSALADDLTQEAFVVAWRKCKQGLPPAALGAFLRRTAKWLWLQSCRERRREALAMAALTQRLWDRQCAGDEGDSFVSRVAKCVEDLAPRARTALQRVHVEEVDRAAVAVELGLLPNGLKMLLQRARQAVLECVRRRSWTS